MIHQERFQLHHQAQKRIDSLCNHQFDYEQWLPVMENKAKISLFLAWTKKNHLKCCNINILISSWLWKFFQCSINGFMIFSVFDIANITCTNVILKTDFHCLPVFLAFNRTVDTCSKIENCKVWWDAACMHWKSAVIVIFVFWEIRRTTLTFFHDSFQRVRFDDKK